MKGLLLIGGKATRLKPLSKNIAKSLLPVCDMHILTYQIRLLREAGVYDIILATGHYAEQYFMAKDLYRELDVDIRISIEHQPLGTAGAIARAKRFIGGDQVLVLNADILCDIDLKEFQKQHALGGRPASITGYQVEDPTRFGLLKLEESSETGQEEVRGFIEKPKSLSDIPRQDSGYYINAGIYLLEPEAVRTIADGVPVSIERETFPNLIELYGGLNHFAYDGLWVDIGTFAGYYEANLAVLRQYLEPSGLGRDGLFWRIKDEHTKQGEKQYEVFDNAVYAARSAVMGPNSRTEQNVVLMEGVEIGAGSVLEDCILLPGAIVGSRCKIKRAIIGTGVELPDNSVIENKLVFNDEPEMEFDL